MRRFWILSPVPVCALAKPATELNVMDGGVAGRPVQMMALLAALSLIPFAVMMLSSFAKISVVLSLARSAMGTQQAPPTMILTGLAAVLTAHIMAPVAERMYRVGQEAFLEAQSGPELLAAGRKTAEPLREFLLAHGSPVERARFAELARELRPQAEAHLVSDTDLSVIVPAFVVTELAEAF